MSLWDLITGQSAADAATTASTDTYEKMMEEAQRMRQYGGEYRDAYADLAPKYDPFITGGREAYDMYRAGLGFGGRDDQREAIQAFHNTPGYRMGMKTGTAATMANSNTNNMLRSGTAAKDLYKFGAGFNTQQWGTHLDRLMGLSNQGYNAVGAQNATIGQGLAGQLQANTAAGNFGMQAAPVIGQGMVAGAQSQTDAFNNLLRSATYLGGQYLGGKA